MCIRDRPDTTYQHIDRRGKTACNCQIAFAETAQDAVKHLEELDKTKPYKPIRNSDLIKE